MYTQLLTNGNTEFATSVYRPGWNVHPTQALRDVLTGVSQCQGGLTQVNLRTLLNRLFTWQTNQSAEYQDRGQTNGVGYRLWMEAKQLLRNRFGMAYADHGDPPQPPGCPGTVLLGAYVPPGEGDAEICHGFSYRWLVASGRMPIHPDVSPVGGNYNGHIMKPVFFPFPRPHYPPVRVAGTFQVQAGDLIGFFDGPYLMHSLIAEDQTHWFGANNFGCFGSSPGRTRVDMTTLGSRWINADGRRNADHELLDDGGHVWRHFGQGGAVVAVFRRDFS